MPPPSRNPQGPTGSLSDHPLFSDCSAEELKQLVAQSQWRTFQPEELLLREGDEGKFSFALMQGSVRVVLSSNNGEGVMALLFTAPAFFGEMECLVGLRYLESVYAHTPTRVLVIPRETLIATLRKSPSFCFHLLRDVSARLCIAARNQSSLAFDEAENRLASFLLGYIERFGEVVGGQVRFSKPVTQEGLAEAIGATTRSIQRTLQEWKKLGIISGSGRKLCILDMPALKSRAGALPPRIDYRIGEVLGRPIGSSV